MILTLFGLLFLLGLSSQQPYCDVTRNLEMACTQVPNGATFAPKVYVNHPAHNPMLVWHVPFSPCEQTNWGPGNSYEYGSGAYTFVSESGSGIIRFWNGDRDFELQLIYNETTCTTAEVYESILYREHRSTLMSL